MSGNGVRIGMGAIALLLRRILQDLLRALAAWPVVAAGAVSPGSAVCRTGSASRQTTGSAASASASSFSSASKV